MQTFVYKLKHFFIYIGLFIFVLGNQVQGQTKSPLTLAQILTGLQAKSEVLNTLAKKNRKITADVNERGVEFDLIPAFETALRNAGANDLLIAAILRKNSKPTGSAGAKTSYYKRAEANRKKGNYDQAIKDYDKAIQLNPKYVLAYYYRGFSYNQKGNYDQAILDYTKAIGLKPDFDIAYTERGKLYNRKGNYDQAISDYTKAIEINPKSTIAYYERGLTYINKENYDQAIKDHTAAIRLRPGFAQAYLSRGFSHKKNGTYHLAISDYTKAIELKPDFEIAYNNRGVAYQERGKSGDYKKAIADYRKALQINPNNGPARDNLESILKKTGENNNSPTTKAGSKTISAGIVNGKATYLPPPIYPAAAKAVDAKGSVNVRVLIDEKGKVVSATAVSGHPLLKAPAVSAARLAEFAPTKLAGKPVKVSGIVVYNFY